MFNPKPEKILAMFQEICKTHRGDIHSAYLDWEIITLEHPGYEGKIQQVVPLMVVDFK